MLKDEIRSLTGPALDQAVERVSGYKIKVYSKSWFAVEHNRDRCGDFYTEPNARDFIAVKLLREAERRGWIYTLSYETYAEKVHLCSFNRDTPSFGSQHEAVSRAFLLAAGETQT